jgi:hypothetical protein
VPRCDAPKAGREFLVAVVELHAAFEHLAHHAGHVLELNALRKMLWHMHRPVA